MLAGFLLRDFHGAGPTASFITPLLQESCSVINVSLVFRRHGLVKISHRKYVVLEPQGWILVRPLLFRHRKLAHYAHVGRCGIVRCGLPAHSAATCVCVSAPIYRTVRDPRETRHANEHGRDCTRNPRQRCTGSRRRSPNLHTGDTQSASTP